LAATSPHCRKPKFFDSLGGHISLYVNVDPAVTLAALKTVSHPSVADTDTDPQAVKLSHLVDVPATLEEFQSTIAPAANIMFDCVVMLGAWHLQLGTDASRAAFGQAVSGAKLVVLESPSSVNQEGLTLGGPVLEAAGFKPEPEHEVVCTEDKESIPLARMTGMLQRHMVAYIRQDAS